MNIISLTFKRFRTKSLKILNWAKSLQFSGYNTRNPIFLFPGQGSQHLGMLESFDKSNHSSFGNLFQKASKILDYDLFDVCCNGPKAQLDSTIIAQPAIFVSSMVALEKLRISNPKLIESCSAAMGLSLGEYSALCFADVFSFEDGVKITKARGEAMQEASNQIKSAMISIYGVDENTILKVFHELNNNNNNSNSNNNIHLTIANYLSHNHFVIAGDEHACETFLSIAPKFGIKSRFIIRLPVAGAFHTSFMKHAEVKLRQVLSTIEFQSPRSGVTVYSNVTGAPHPNDGNLIKENLINQLTSPVQWYRLMEPLVSNSHRECDKNSMSIYEIGPGTACSGILKKLRVGCPIHSVSAAS